MDQSSEVPDADARERARQRKKKGREHREEGRGDAPAATGSVYGLSESAAGNYEANRPDSGGLSAGHLLFGEEILEEILEDDRPSSPAQHEGAAVGFLARMYALWRTRWGPAFDAPSRPIKTRVQNATTEACRATSDVRAKVFGAGAVELGFAARVWGMLRLLLTWWTGIPLLSQVVVSMLALVVAIAVIVAAAYFFASWLWGSVCTYAPIICNVAASLVPGFLRALNAAPSDGYKGTVHSPSSTLGVSTSTATTSSLAPPTLMTVVRGPWHRATAVHQAANILEHQLVRLGAEGANKKAAESSDGDTSDPARQLAKAILCDSQRDLDDLFSQPFWSRVHQGVRTIEQAHTDYTLSDGLVLLHARATDLLRDVQTSLFVQDRCNEGGQRNSRENLNTNWIPAPQWVDPKPGVQQRLFQLIGLRKEAEPAWQQEMQARVGRLDRLLAEALDALRSHASTLTPPGEAGKGGGDSGPPSTNDFGVFQAKLCALADIAGKAVREAEAKPKKGPQPLTTDPRQLGKASQPTRTSKDDKSNPPSAPVPPYGKAAFLLRKMESPAYLMCQWVREGNLHAETLLSQLSRGIQAVGVMRRDIRRLQQRDMATYTIEQARFDEEVVRATVRGLLKMLERAFLVPQQEG